MIIDFSWGNGEEKIVMNFNNIISFYICGSSESHFDKESIEFECMEKLHYLVTFHSGKDAKAAYQKICNSINNNKQYITIDESTDNLVAILHSEKYYYIMNESKKKKDFQINRTPHILPISKVWGSY